MKKSIQDLIDYKNKIEKKYLNKGITGIDVGYKITNGKVTDQIAVRFHVPKKLPKEELKKSNILPRTLNNVKTDVLENNFEYLTTITTFEVNSSILASDSKRYDVLQGGIEISPTEPVHVSRDSTGRIISKSFETGTLGAIVFDKNLNEEVLLTNNHVLSVGGVFTVGGGINQPAGDRRINRIATNLKNVNDNLVDGATGRLNGERPFLNSIVDIGVIRGAGTVGYNDAVRKRGRTTLYTEGYVDGMAGTFYINTRAGLKEYRDIISVRSNSQDPFSSHGDSGSVVVNSQNQIIGLLFAGTPSVTLVCPINNVLSALNLSIINDEHDVNIDDYPLLKLGYRGKYVKILQEKLNLELTKKLVVDGIFGKKTLQAVLSFQRNNHLQIDGIVGPQTWAELLLID